MGKIFYIMGKSASGKDTIYENLKREENDLRRVVLYTTRPMRSGEVDGVTYHFVTHERYQEIQKDSPEKIIEARTYQTIHGPWTYFTLDDGQWDFQAASYIMVGTLESYQGMKQYFGEDILFPLYIEVEDGERLSRALSRERSQREPHYEEMCRRFLADQKDFSEENLMSAGITKRFRNRDITECIQELREVIDNNR